MSYQRKTKDRWDIMTNWGYGWECENSEYTRADAKRSLSLEMKNTMKFTFLSMRTAKLTESLIACQCRSHGQELPMMRRRELVFQRERDGIL